MYRSLKSTEERLVKKLMRLRICSISAALRAVLDSASGLFAFRRLLTRKKQDIPLPLMIALMMIMLHIFLERMPERVFPK